MLLIVNVVTFGLELLRKSFDEQTKMSLAKLFKEVNFGFLPFDMFIAINKINRHLSKFMKQNISIAKLM